VTGGYGSRHPAVLAVTLPGLEEACPERRIWNPPGGRLSRFAAFRRYRVSFTVLSLPGTGLAGGGAMSWFRRRSGGGMPEEGPPVTGRTEAEDDSPAWADMPVPTLDLLTAGPDKRLRYTADPLLREGWATLVGVLG
jgi:hypothetical protein